MAGNVRRGRRVAGLLCCTAVVLSVTTACGGDPTRLATGVHHQVWSPGSPKPAAAGPSGAPGWVVGSSAHRDIREVTLSQLEARIRAAQARVTSVHYTSSGGNSSHPQFDIKLDLTTGNIDMAFVEGDETVDLRQIGSQYYFKANLKFWIDAASGDNVPTSVLNFLANKWVKTPPGQFTDFPIAYMRDAGNPVQLLRLDNTSRVLPEETVNGTTMLVLSVRGENSGQRGKMYVPLTGDAVPTRVIDVDGTQIDYTPSAQPFGISAPTGPDVVNLPAN